MPLRQPEQFIKEGSKVFHRAGQNRASSTGWLSTASDLMKDAENKTVSNTTRLSAAYDAMLNFALVALSAQEYRVTSADGHHVQTLEAACALIGASDGLLDRVDAIRSLRNNRYTGIQAKESEVGEAISAMKEFGALFGDWLQKAHPGFPTKASR